MREAMNTHSREEMVAAVLWGTFQKNRVMEDYMRYGIENHPSISSEHGKFLVTNSSRDNTGGVEISWMDWKRG